MVIATLHLQSLVDSAVPAIPLPVAAEGYADRRLRPEAEHLSVGGWRQGAAGAALTHEYVLPVTHVGSADRVTLDRWWARGDRLRLLLNASDTDVGSRLRLDCVWGNAGHPLPQRVPAYDDRWLGTLVLRGELAGEPGVVEAGGFRFTLSSSDYGRLSVNRLD